MTWSHYKRLLTVSKEDARAWYLKEAAEQMWSYRTLDRNIGSQYYERLLLSQHKENVEAEMRTLTKPFDRDRMEFIKNPTVAEFIGLSPNTDFTESDLEGAIIANLEKFLLELGKGFSFVARQKLIRTEKKDYFIDLVFYNYILKSFVCNQQILNRHFSVNSNRHILNRRLLVYNIGYFIMLLIFGFLYPPAKDESCTPSKMDFRFPIRCPTGL